jgi:hypothetical protein
VIRLVNDAADEVHRNEAKHNGWIKGARYLWLKNLQNFNEEERPRSSGWRRPISTPYRLGNRRNSVVDHQQPLQRQRPGRQQGQRHPTKHDLELMIYLIAGGVLDVLPN